MDIRNFNVDQEEALIRMLSGKNVFLTGEAGTGKSAILHEFRKIAGDGVAFLAPTGAAARNINGTTIHRFFELQAGPLPPGFDPEISRELMDKLAATNCLVIDEVSMVRSDLLWTIDAICKAAAPPCSRSKSFGGIQVVAVGDFFQLPPIVQNDREELWLLAYYGGLYAFETWAWFEADFEPVVLKKIHRQAGDNLYAEILCSIRTGNMCANYYQLMNAIELFNSRVLQASPIDDSLVLCATNRRANAINEIRDRKLGDTAYHFRASVCGFYDDRNYPTDFDLYLRNGSRIMMVANCYNAEIPHKLDFVNGDMGHVIRVDPEVPMLEIMLDNGRRIKVERKDWNELEYVVEPDPETGEKQLQQRHLGTFTQLPVRLASAISIHRAQGLTLDCRVHVELGRRLFASGQLYVALSRCKTLTAVSVDRMLSPRDIIPDSRIAKFYRKLEARARNLAANSAYWI